MNKYIFILLFFLAGCSYLDNAGMNEWDYKMYQEGWELEYIEEGRESLRWTNGTATTND